jgi:hypothetical protein
VVRNPAGIHLARQPFDFCQIVEIERIGAADRQRHAVHHDRIPLGDLLQDMPRPSSRIDEILRDHLKPIDGRPGPQNVPEMHAPQPNAKT